MAERSNTEKRILEVSCLEFGVASELVDELIDLEIENERRLRRRGLFDHLKNAIENHVRQHEDDSP